MRICVAIALSLVAVPSVGQPVAASDSLCAYETCAIRLEQTFFGGMRIVRGSPEDDVDVGGIGWFGGGLADYVADSPKALSYAESSRSYRVGSAATGVAGVVLLALSVDQIYALDGARGTAYYVTGLGLAVVSGVLGLTANRQQARAVWEYNRSLAP